MNRTASIASLVVLLWAALPARAAQRDNRSDSHPAKSSRKTISFSGRVSVDGKTIVCDRDSRVWKVVNREMLGGSEGRRVTVRAYAEPDSSEITVVRLREERTTAKLDDAAFRR